MERAGDLGPAQSHHPLDDPLVVQLPGPSVCVQHRCIVLVMQVVQRSDQSLLLDALLLGAQRPAAVRSPPDRLPVLWPEAADLARFDRTA